MSRQEAGGALTHETARLGIDRVLKARQSSAAARYVARRDALAEIDRDAPPPGGGPDRIKCLHAHVAQELADPPNPIGASALDAAGWPECVVGCVEKPKESAG